MADAPKDRDVIATAAQVDNPSYQDNLKVRRDPDGSMWIVDAQGRKVMSGVPANQRALGISTTSDGLVVNTVVRITQANYLALVAKDPDTLYLINEGGIYLGTTQMGGSGGPALNGVTFTANGLSQLLYLTANGIPLLPGKAISTSYTSNTAIQSDGTTAASAGWSTGELQAADFGLCPLGVEHLAIVVLIVADDKIRIGGEMRRNFGDQRQRFRHLASAQQ